MLQIFGSYVRSCKKEIILNFVLKHHFLGKTFTLYGATNSDYLSNTDGLSTIFNAKITCTPSKYKVRGRVRNLLYLIDKNLTPDHTLYRIKHAGLRDIDIETVHHIDFVCKKIVF